MWGYWKIILKEAWQAAAGKFSDKPARSLIVAALLFMLGAGFTFHQEGIDALRDMAMDTLLTVFGPVGIAAILFFGFEVLRRPYRREQELLKERDDLREEIKSQRGVFTDENGTRYVRNPGTLVMSGAAIQGSLVIEGPRGPDR